MKNSQIVLGVVLCVIVSVIGYVLVFNKEPVSQEKVFKVGVSQIVAHPAFDAVREGIVAQLAQEGFIEGKNIIFDFQNAQGEQSINQAIAQKFSNSDYDIFIPLGTPTSQSLVKLVVDRPVIFGMVTDPVSAGLVTSKEVPGKNITGTSDVVLYKENLEFLKKIIPHAKKIGVVYNPSDASALYSLEQVKKYAEVLGLEVISAPVNNTNEIVSAAKSIAFKIDTFFMIQDSTVEAGQEAIIKLALDEKKPLIAFEQSGVEKGALAGLGTNYKKIGEKTGEIAARVLRGENPGTISVVGVTDANIFINKNTASVIGVPIPEEIMKDASRVY